MTDGVNDATGTAVEEDGTAGEVESPAELAVAVLWDGVIGAVAGSVGNAVILGTLVLMSMVGLFELESFATTAGILSFGGVVGGDQVLVAGLLLFLGGGATVLPLLLATLGIYLPGQRYASKGLVFGAAIWTGFVIAYYSGYSGLALVGYLAGTLLAHLGYGYATGWTMDRLFSADDRPVLAASVASPMAIAERSEDADSGVPRAETTLVDEDDQ